jgi:hypothetical protein
VDSLEPTIEEKLVPFVEGALAEADRREVMQALPNSPALTQEVRLLREAILLLRTQAARGMTYHSPVEAPPEQVVDFALQGDQWSRQSSRQFQLHMLESSSLSEELEILKELEQDLQQRAESSKPVPEMSAALRAAIQEAYGRPAPEPGWKKTMAALVAWMAGMNLKVAAAAVASCVVVAAGVGMGRYAHQQMQVPAQGGTVAVADRSSASPSPAAAVFAAATPAGQVALLKEKVLPEDLPGLSRRLWQKQVSHSYRDGQIYVAQADYEKAWGALQLNPEKIAVAHPLRTGAVPPEEKKTNLLDGVIGMVPNAAPAPKPVVPKDRAAAGAASQPLANKADTAEPSPAAAVAVHLPSAPEASQGGPGDDANYQVAPEGDRGPVGPVADRATAAQRSPDAPRPAIVPSQDSYRPSQMARPAPTEKRRQVAAPEPVVRQEVADPPASSKMKSVFQGNRKRQATPDPRNYVAPKNEAPVVVESVAPAVQPISRPNVAVQRDLADKPSPSLANSHVGVKESGPDGQLEEEAPPLPQPANLPAYSPPAVPSQIALESKGVPSGQAPVDEALRGGVASAPRAETSSSPPAVASGGRVAAKVAGGEAPAAVPAQRASNVNLGRTAPGATLAKSDEGYTVQANAPFEVAMLPVAKKLIEELVGDSKVQMERKEDGHILVTIRPARSLSPQEVDKLRKVVREKLELEDEDTVVIRQP